MDVAEVLRRSNQASLDSLVPLTKIQTRMDMKRYAQNGYSVGITAKEFSEKYPLLPVENIYFSDNLFDTLYYGELDFEIPIVLNLQIYGNKRLSIRESDEEFQKRVLATVANIKTLNKNHLSFYVNSLSDGLSMSVLATYADVTFIPYSPFGSLQIFSADNIRPCRTLPLAHTQQQSRRRTKQLPQQAEWKRIARNS